jgi:hypothetical protein
LNIEFEELLNRITLIYGDDNPNFGVLELALNSKEISAVFKILMAVEENEEHKILLEDIKNILVGNETKNSELIFSAIDTIVASSEDTEKVRLAIRHFKFLIQKSVSGKLKNDMDTFASIRKIINVVGNEKQQTIMSYLLGYSEISNFKLFDIYDAISDTECVGIDQLRKFLKFNVDDEYNFKDALSSGQIKSKLWLIHTIKQLQLDLGTAYVCGGWYGVLPFLMNINAKENFTRFVSFDIDPKTDLVADILNKELVKDSASFIPVVKNIHDITYEEYEKHNYFSYVMTSDGVEPKERFVQVDEVNTVINTSCEHIANFKEWYEKIPEGTLMILQSNDFVEHDDETVVNTYGSADDFAWDLGFKPRNKKDTRLNDLNSIGHKDALYIGTLRLEKYNRFMVIGRK